MGHKASWRIIYVTIGLLVAAVLIYSRPAALEPENKVLLSKEFKSFGGWNGIDDVKMQKDVLDALELDDFLFREYSNDNRIATLYIGYYLTSNKLGAVHSPLVCFPGQGWEISKPENVTIAWKSGRIGAQKLVVSKGQYKQMLLYWYQAYDMTSGGTLRQKINNYWARLNSKPQDNAFVRVSVLIQDDNYDAAYQTAMHFVQSFYPDFLQYITS